MYTQCPECGVAFRVTAEVLRQAAGKVRCGGCGVAFNALEHLSEEKPQAPVHPGADTKLPELTPDEPGELEADTPPQSISAEQSAALLKTLDQLAGSNIRIEDTGVEWRVLEDGEEEPEAEAAEAEAIEEAEDELRESDLIADTGSLKFFIEDDDQDEPVEEMRFDDNTPLPDDFDLDTPAPEPPAVEAPQPMNVAEAAQADLELGDPDEWKDLLGEVAEPEAEEISAEKAQQGSEDVPVVEPEDEPEDDIVVLSDSASGEPPDVDTQFAIQAEAMGIDLSGLHEQAAQEDAELDDDSAETSIDEDLIAFAFEAEAAARENEAEAEEPVPEPEAKDERETERAEEERIDESGEVELEEDEDIAEPIAELAEEPVDEQSLEIKLDDEEEPVEPVRDEHAIPEMTEEEKTINLLIDQDLLSVAVEDEDGFASTIVQRQPDKNIADEIDDLNDIDVDTEDGESAKVEKKGEKKEEKKPTAPKVFETIIMEGNIVRGEDDKKREKANRELREKLKARKAEEERALRDREARGRRRMMLAGAAGLALLLLVQLAHHSREALATIPAFRNTVGPVYRMVGKPLTPAYDITGWRFEQTKNNIDEAKGVLSIYSRIGNISDKALPYPLVNVTLTDRFEDPIGSRVLEPSEYLSSDTDPREPVAAGSTFDAVISIESPDVEATGFKLNVCYRMASGQLRCAIEDFK